MSIITVRFAGSSLWNAMMSWTGSCDGQRSITIPSSGAAPGVRGFMASTIQTDVKPLRVGPRPLSSDQGSRTRPDHLLSGWWL